MLDQAAIGAARGHEGRLAEFDKEIGKLEEAQKEAEEALYVAEMLDRNSEQALARCTLADIALLENRVDEARSQMERIDVLMGVSSQEARTRALATRRAFEQMP
jgi:hypothetical protein